MTHEPTQFACAGVLFDSDGVLVDSDASVVAAWTRWARESGLDPDPVLASVHGRPAAASVAAFLPPEAVAEGVARINRYEVEDAAQVRALPGAADLLASMPPGTWAVVTSATRALARARLGAANLPIPDVLVTADDVTKGKPDPEGYATAARRLGLPAVQTVVIEDAGNGIEAAHRAGVGYAIGVGERGRAGNPDVLIEDLRALRWTGKGLAVQRL
ncbi:MAG: HAD-IA family hydrolase [Mycobacterium sp.]